MVIGMIEIGSRGSAQNGSKSTSRFWDICAWLEAAPLPVQEAHRSQTTPTEEGVPFPDRLHFARSSSCLNIFTHCVSPSLQFSCVCCREVRKCSVLPEVSEAMVEEVGAGQGGSQAGEGEQQLNPHRR